MIEVKDLVKTYGNHVAVDHLSFQVEDGQIYGFLGPNGAGKSTTMNIMTGYLGADSGQVFIDGKNMLEEPEAAKARLGYLPEIPPLYTDMTVKEYLDFAAGLKKLPKSSKQQSIAEAMELVGITDVSGRLIRNLSKGYRQRVGMAQALLGNPQVIILDEPTVGLDPKQIIEIRDMIKSLGKKHTVILSSHILSEVSAVCDHILIINHGKLIASDTPENLERQLSGATGLTLSVKGEEAAVRDLLSNIAGVENLTPLAAEEDHVFRFRIDYAKTSESSADVRESIFFACANAGLPILAMEPVRASLEEVFLELTEGEKEVTSDDSNL